MNTAEQKIKETNYNMTGQAVVCMETDDFFYANPRKPITMVELQEKVVTSINQDINMERIVNDQSVDGTDWMLTVEELRPYLEKAVEEMIERKEIAKIETATGPGFVYFENNFNAGVEKDMMQACKIIALMTIDQKLSIITLDKEEYEDVVSLKKAVEEDTFTFELTTTPEGGYDISPLMSKVQMVAINKPSTWAVCDMAFRLFVQEFNI